MKKIVLLFFTVMFVLTPMIAHAQIDQRCWKKEVCTGEEFKGTFYQGKDSIAACGEKNAIGDVLGFCLPVGTIDTAISFGGKKTFTNIGAFIDFIYKYGVSIAGILAVVMIIIAGVQWTLSAGSPERIGAAKKRIAGASVGVLLATLSYVILNTINPYLVNIRLPQVWMINQQGLAPPSCDQVKGSGVSWAGREGDKIDAKKADNAKYKPVEELKPECGNDYFVEGTGGQTCTGTLCPGTEPSVCYKGLQDKTRSCHKASIAGIGYSSSVYKHAGETLAGWALDATFGDGWTFEWFDDPEIYAVCTEPVSLAGKKFTAFSAGNEGTESFDQEKLLVEFQANISKSKIEAAKKICKGGVKGYALWLEFDEVGDGNDEEMFIGRNSTTGEAVTLGEDNVANDIFPRKEVNQYLFTEEELKNGYYLRFDVTKICDIDDEDTDRAKCYAHIGGWK